MKKGIVFLLASIMLLSISQFTVLFAQTSPDEQAQGNSITMVITQGEVYVYFREGGNQAATPGMILQPNQAIQTGPNGRCGVSAYGQRFIINPGSFVTFQQINERFRLVMNRGSVYRRSSINASSTLMVQTPTAVLGVRGTEFDVRADDLSSSKVRVREGQVLAWAANNEAAIDPNVLFEDDPLQERVNELQTRIEEVKAEIQSMDTEPIEPATGAAGTVGGAAAPAPDNPDQNALNEELAGLEQELLNILSEQANIFYEEHPEFAGVVVQAYSSYEARAGEPPNREYIGELNEEDMADFEENSAYMDFVELVEQAESVRDNCQLIREENRKLKELLRQIDAWLGENDMIFQELDKLNLEEDDDDDEEEMDEGPNQPAN